MLTETESLERIWPERYVPPAPSLAAGAAPPARPYDADIIILTIGRQRATLAAIASALRQRDVSAHVTVLDQGSSPTMRRRFTRLFAGCTRVGYYIAPENLGVAGGRNFLSEIGHGTIIVALDNDAVFADAFVVRDAARQFAEAPSLGVAAFRIMDAAGAALDDRSWGYPAALKRLAAGRFLTTTFVGAGHAIRRSTWQQVGGYDKNLFFTWEEYDFALRAIAAGWRIQYSGELAVRHRLDPEARVRWQGGRTEFFVRNRLHIARKWGASWVALAPRMAGYLVKGALNGGFSAAARGIAAARRMEAGMAPQKMPAAMRDYLREHEQLHRGSLLRRLGPELFGTVSDQPVREAAGRANF
jgi:GT2 family glycosyltransferase